MQIKDLRPGPSGEPPQIKTASPMVKKAREGVMEFLLINHPLDCPICDQGGECDLQDQAVAYGVDFSRYRETKRAAEDLDLGPLVETHMTRCISCTRCVRFTTEVAGISQMGQTGRGEDSEITSYLASSLNTELQGNIIDLCPVGALTSKPYAFTARSWELEKTDSVDVMDALGSNIRLDCKGREIMRILPRNNDSVNEEWISDKTRFVFDGLRRQRLDRPYLRKNGQLVAVSWREALNVASVAIKGKKFSAVIGDLVSTESTYALKQLSDKLGGNYECRVDGSCLPVSDRSGYIGNTEISELDNCDHIVLIGTNPRMEAPVFNARIRKAWLNNTTVSLIGEKVDLTYEYAHLGSTRSTIDTLIKTDDLNLSTNSVIIVGQGALTEEDGEEVLQGIKKLVEKHKCKFLVLHVAASRVGAMDVGFTHPGGLKSALEGAEVIFNLGMDEFELPEDCLVIYQGSHGDRGANRADIIFPAACYTEESGIYINTEGRCQLAFRANFAPGEAKENWAILRALSGELNCNLGFNNLVELRSQLIKDFPHMSRLNEISKPQWHDSDFKGFSSDQKFKAYYKNFYKTNPIARASLVLNDLSKNQSSDNQIRTVE
jgi:NADH-quinone oxidoreductase subunit G